MLGALSGLPRSEPILDELHDLLERNARVRVVRDTIEANWGTVAARFDELVSDLADTPALDSAQLKAANEKIHASASALQPLAYPMYVRLKVSSAVDAFARAACLACDYSDASNQAYLVRELVRDWAGSRELFQHEGAPSEQQLSFIADFDLGYAQRRLQFVIDGVSWLYRDLATAGFPRRQQLDALKERLGEAAGKLEWLASGRAFAGAVLDGVATCFGEQRLTAYLDQHGFDAGAFLEAHADELDLLNEALRGFLGEQQRTFTPDLYSDLLALTQAWAPGEVAAKIRRDLLVRYLLFPIWDALLYPVQAYTDLGERDHVRVVRMSPVDSTLLASPGGGHKVMGAGLGHAYAFFSREARENDYLWGRLDAAESIVRLLLTHTTPADELVLGSQHPEYRSRCKSAFLAVLEEEEPHLPTIGGIVASIRTQVEAL